MKSIKVYENRNNMKSCIKILCILVVLLSCNRMHQEPQILLLYYQGNTFTGKDTIIVYNEDNTPCDSFFLSEENKVFSNISKDSILQYYEHYPLVSFFCCGSNGDYFIIKVGDGWKYISKTEPFTVYSYDEYFRKFFKYFKPEIGDIFFKDNFKTVECVWKEEDESLYYKNEEAWSFYFIEEVKGDWLKISSLGWFKWKDGFKTKIDRCGVLC